jgi:acyl carrier protein
MGLDTVELVMEIEEDFGITISDAVAEHCRTVNEVALYVYGQIQARPVSHSGDSPNAIRFQELRRAIAERTNVSPESILPESPADEAIPHAIRRKLWSRSKVPLSELRRPGWARTCIAFTGFGTFVLFMLILVAGRVDGISATVLAAAIAVVPLLLVTVLLRPFKRELPPTIHTICDLARGMFHARKNHEPLPGETTFPQVLLRIRQITADQMGLPLEQVLPHSRFVEDLEMD